MRFINEVDVYPAERATLNAHVSLVEKDGTRTSMENLSEDGNVLTIVSVLPATHMVMELVALGITGQWDWQSSTTKSPSLERLIQKGGDQVLVIQLDDMLSRGVAYYETYLYEALHLSPSGRANIVIFPGGTTLDQINNVLGALPEWGKDDEVHGIPKLRVAPEIMSNVKEMKGDELEGRSSDGES